MNENKHINEFEDQEINGKNVFGGNSGDLSLTEDFSNQMGTITDSIISDCIPLNQDPLGNLDITIVVDSPLVDVPTHTNFSGEIGPVQNNA